MFERWRFFPIFENLFTFFSCLFTIFQKNLHLSNTFWFYQHRVRNAQFQRQSKLKKQILIWVTLQQYCGRRELKLHNHNLRKLGLSKILKATVLFQQPENYQFIFVTIGKSMISFGMLKNISYSLCFFRFKDSQFFKIWQTLITFTSFT